MPAAPTTAVAAADLDELLTARLIVVTGKGGVGKTTVAAAIAVAGARAGRRTLLAEVEARQGLSRLLTTAAWTFADREIRPNLWGLSVDPEESLFEYLEQSFGLKRVARVMSRVNAIDFVTAAAPGLRDLLLLGKLYEAERRRRPDGRPAYDLVVLDAPPLGRIVPFLSSPTGTSEIVRGGPVRRQADNITEMLHDPRRTRAIVVTLLEEMPVTETLEGVDGLRRIGIDVGPVVANQVLPERFDKSARTVLRSMAPDTLVERRAAARIELAPQAAELGLSLARTHLQRVELQKRMRTLLAPETERFGLVELPLLTRATFGIPELERLADLLGTERAGGA
ncbi:MAG TPA: ArsA-related P-loop ATPase [Solirubrobacteraceae bacterium]|nr:ArsA-related P-loop ATPase [Solirubrobacteraceae bacterium]